MLFLTKPCNAEFNAFLGVRQKNMLTKNTLLMILDAMTFCDVTVMISLNVGVPNMIFVLRNELEIAWLLSIISQSSI